MGMEFSNNIRKVVGQVVSDKMDKTVVVKVERRVKHPLYKKVVRRYTKLVAHDAENAYKIGDVVAVVECRPLSKRKAWQVLERVDVQRENS